MVPLLVVICVFIIGNVLALDPPATTSVSAMEENPFISQISFKTAVAGGYYNQIVFYDSSSFWEKTINLENYVLNMQLFPQIGYEDRLSCWIHGSIPAKDAPDNRLRFTLGYCEKFNCTKPLGFLFEAENIRAYNAMSLFHEKKLKVQIDCKDISMPVLDNAFKSLKFDMPLTVDTTKVVRMSTKKQNTDFLRINFPCEPDQALYFVAEEIGDTLPTVNGQHIQLTERNNEIVCERVAAKFLYADFNAGEKIPDSLTPSMYSMMVNGVQMRILDGNLHTKVPYRIQLKKPKLNIKFSNDFSNVKCKAYALLDLDASKQATGKIEVSSITPFVILDFTDAHVDRYMDVFFPIDKKRGWSVVGDLEGVKLTFQLKCDEPSTHEFFFNAILTVHSDYRSTSLRSPSDILSDYKTEIPYFDGIPSVFIATPTGPNGIAAATTFARRMACEFDADECVYENLDAPKGSYPLVLPQPPAAGGVSPSDAGPFNEDEHGAAAGRRQGDLQARDAIASTVTYLPCRCPGPFGNKRVCPGSTDVVLAGRRAVGCPGPMANPRVCCTPAGTAQGCGTTSVCRPSERGSEIVEDPSLKKKNSTTSTTSSSVGLTFSLAAMLCSCFLSVYLS